MVFALLTVLLLSVGGGLRAQRANSSWDAGAGLSLIGYTGDYNPTALPMTFSGAGQLVLRYNLTPMYALRAELNGGGYRGKYIARRTYLPMLGQEPALKFHRPFLSLAVSVEIHLLPFQVDGFSGRRENPDPITPYVTAGIGGTYVFSHGGALSIPMGAGVKFALGDRFTLSPEVRFVKSFSDKLDSYKNWPLGRERSFIHNQDWMSMLTVTLTYRFLFRSGGCPAYQQNPEVFM